jgi:hypothetical protein
MFGVDEPYDRDGAGLIGGTPWDPSPEAAPPEDTAAEAEEPTEALEPPIEDPEPAEGAEPAQDAAEDDEAAADAPAVREPAQDAAVPSAPAPTGDERVDVALARFGELSEAPVADHVEVFEDVQRRLQDVLASVDHDEAQGPSDPPDGRS